ncbi:ATP-binding cassette sub-family A member 13 [Tiliqua scincoides]|uniref:ATP-binding cassette sub-family A member 13 n=1 Tax=Tiliqua scincoides TaxID=71010 RepID=UPI00346184E7
MEYSRKQSLKAQKASPNTSTSIQTMLTLEKSTERKKEDQAGIMDVLREIREESRQMKTQISNLDKNLTEKLDQLSFKLKEMDEMAKETRKKVNRNQIEINKMKEQAKKDQVKIEQLTQCVEVADQRNLVLERSIMLLELQQAGCMLRVQNYPEEKQEDIRATMIHWLGEQTEFETELLEGGLHAVYRLRSVYAKAHNLPREIMLKFTQKRVRDMVQQALMEKTLMVGGNPMNLNETEAMISQVESFHHQPYVWDLLYSLPWLETGSLQEHGIEYLSKFLTTIQNSLAILEDLDVMPSNKKFYEAIKIGLNVTVAVLQTWNADDLLYNLSLWDIVWNPNVVKTDLESQFGLEKSLVERILNYTVNLSKIPTKDTLDKFVCLVLTSVSEPEADKRDNERGCIFPPWLEAKTYLVHSVDLLKLCTKILMSDASCTLNNILRVFEKSLVLLQDSRVKDVLEAFVCHQNHSNESSKLRDQIQLIKESVQLLQNTIQGQPSMPVSITEGYLGWQDIGEKIAETSAVCYEMMKLLNEKQPVEFPSFSSCQEQLIQLLFWDILDELWFGFEKNFFWKGLSTIVRKTCEMVYYVNEQERFTRRQSDASQTLLCSQEKLNLKAITDNYASFLQNFSKLPFTSWVRIVTFIQEFLKSENNLWKLDKTKTGFIEQLVEFIQEIFLSNSSVSLNIHNLQPIVETVINSTVFLINDLGRTEKEKFLDEDDDILSKLANGVLESFQRLAVLWHYQKANGFLQMMEAFLHEPHPKQPHVLRTEHLVKEVAEDLEVLSRIVMHVLGNQRILNRSLQFFEHFLKDWPEPTVVNADYVNGFSEHFVRILYDIGLLSPEHAATAFSTIYTVRNAIFFLVSNSSSVPKMQELEKMVFSFYQKLHRVEGNHTVLLVQKLASLYHDVDQFLRMQNNGPLVMFFDKVSRNMSVPFQQRDLIKFFEFVLDTVKLLQDLPQKSLCKKLAMLYNYIEHQSQLLVRSGEQEMEAIANALNNPIFLDKERCIAAFRHLKQLAGTPMENSFINISETPPVNHSSSFMLSLFGHLPNAPPLGNETDGPLSQNCTTAWFQMWFNVLEEVSKLLELDSDFFTDLHETFDFLSVRLTNSNITERCNKTTAVGEQMKSRLNMLKGVTEAADLVDFEAFMYLTTTLSHAVGITSSYTQEELQEVMEMVENVTIELHKILSDANFSSNFLDFWIDIFTPASSELEYKLCAFGKSISNILTHCWEEFQTTFVVLREAIELLNNISQEQNLLSCTEILQNVTKLKSVDILSSQNSSRRWFTVLIKSLLNFENAASTVKDCNAWVIIIKNFIEKYSYFHFENAKDVLILLTSLGPFSETDKRRENIGDILHVTFKLAKLPCLQNITTAHLTSDCFSVVVEYLKLILPTFSDQDDLQIIDFILTLFNYTDWQIENLVQKLTGSSLYAPDSNYTMFLEDILSSNVFPSFLQQFWSSLVEPPKEIQTILKNLSSEYLQNGSFPWHSVIVLKALQSFQQYSINFLKEAFQQLVHFFKDTLSWRVHKVHNITFHTMTNASNIDVELVREFFRMLRSYSLPSFPGVLGEDVFPKHLITLLQQTENMDGELAVKFLRQISKSLTYILTNVSEDQFTESSELNVVASWLDGIASFSWNSTGLWQILQLFQEAELTEVMQIFHELSNAVSLLERIAHKNFTDVLIDVYQFMLKQNANMAVLSKEELSTGINNFLELLDPETGFTKESTNALRCLAAVICWKITTATSWACSLGMQNDSLSIRDMVADFHEWFTPEALQRKLPCSDEHFLKGVTYKMACFLHQLEQWHPVISKFYQGNSSVLNQLLGLWNKLSDYALTSRANISSLTHCILIGKKQTSLQLIETLSNMIPSEIIAAKALFAQFTDLYGDQNTDRDTAVLRIKSILIILNSMANCILETNATEDNLMTFLSAVWPLITLSPARKEAYMMLRALLTLASNGSLIENLEAVWLDTERDIENLLSDFNVRHLLSLIDKEIQLLSTATGQNILMSLASTLRPLTTLFPETPLKSFEDVLELWKKRLQEYSTKDYSKIINTLVVHMAGRKSPDEIIQTINDMIYFLKLFRNGTQEDNPISFITDFLSGKKLKNVQITHSILQNRLLNVIYDLVTKEEELHFNDSDLQIMEFIDMFFDNTQYENYEKDITVSQSRTMELIKEFLQVIFPSSTEHYGNKIFFLLKDIHKDIIAEMSQLDHLNEEGNDVAQNAIYLSLGDVIYSLLSETVMSAGEAFHFDQAKGLMFAKYFLNILLENSAVKKIIRNHEEVLAFTNHMLRSANNSWDFIRLIRNLSATPQFMKQLSAEIKNFMSIPAQNNFSPKFKEIIQELLTSVNSASLLKHSDIIVGAQRLLYILLWSSRVNFTHWPFPEIHEVLKSVSQENSKYGQVEKVIEMLFSFLTLSRKASEHLVTISEALMNSNTTEKLGSLEVVYLAFEKDVRDAVRERSLMKNAEVPDSNEDQLAGLLKTFLDLTHLITPLNHSSLNGPETSRMVAELTENLSKVSGVLVDEIAEFLTSVFNYSIVLEKVVKMVTSTVINSSKEASSLVENLLDFIAPVNSVMQKINLKLIFHQILKQVKERDEIQEAISYVLEMMQNFMEEKAAVRAVTDIFSEISLKNITEQDLNVLLTVAKRQDGALKVLGIILELFNLTSHFTQEHLSALSFLSNPVIQRAVELSILGLFNKTTPLMSLPHLNNNQNWDFNQGLFQTILRTFLRESIIRGNSKEIVKSVLKLLNDFDLPFKSLSSYEKYPEGLIILVEQWQNDQRIYETCQTLHKYLNSEDALLLGKLQAAALHILTVFSGGHNNSAFINNLQCALKSCQLGFTRHFLLSVLEGIHFFYDQYVHTEDPRTASTQGACENFVHLKKKLSSTLAEFQRTLYNNSDNSCECQHVSESINRHLQMLMETIQMPLSGNPLISFLRNFSLPTDVKIKDCVQNTTELVQELHSLTNISDKTISIVMESSISHPKFFSSALAVLLVGKCDVEALSPLLTFPAEGKSPAAIKELCSLPPQELYTMMILLLQNLNLRNIIYKIKIPSEVDNLLNTLLDVVSSISSLLNKAQHVFENLPVFLQTIKSTSLLDISAFQSIFHSGQPRSIAVGSLQSFIKAVCKEESSFFSNTNMFIDMPRITEVLEEDMAKFSIPKDSSQFCLQLYQEILQSPNGALIWTFLKPLLHGKILYTPNTTKINLVIKKANHTFDVVEKLKIYSESWLQMTELAKNSENFPMITQLQDALQNTFVRNFVESQLNVNVKELIEKLREYEVMLDKVLNNSATEQINLMTQFVVNISSCLLLDRFQPVESVQKLEANAQELMKENNFLASVIFNTSSCQKGGADLVHELPKHVSYTIRTSVLYSMRTDSIQNPVWKSHPQNLPASGFKYNHIFVPLQDMIERAIISVHTGTDPSDAGIQVQAMPYPCHTNDLFLNNIGFFFPLIMMLSWMVSVASMVRKLVYEKEIHLEEYMKTMGVHAGAHFVAWFLENIIALAISSCVLTVILKVSAIFAYSNGFLVFLFFLDFGISVTMLSYLLSVFFSTANTAALCASLVYMISFLPYIILLVLQKQLSFANQTVVCFLSTTAFGQGVFFLTLFEGQEIGIHWSNMYQPLAQGGSMTFGWACWMILFDSILYFIVGWYFSNIIPGRVGLKRSWYFPFTLSYWKNMCGAGSKKQSYLNPTVFVVSENFQEIGSSVEHKRHSKEASSEGVVLMSLTKAHSESNKIAVKDLSLTFYKGQITALLGTNGAGKTTVISMLTGLYPPSSGSIIINGKHMETDLAAVRTEMGVCPQYDVLFETLTVQEHLLLYGSVKAPFWTKMQLHQQVNRALNDVGLFQHQYKRVGALSGGMKRRLSIAISFIGNSKTVVLDEPTSSVDPCSRRDIWDILLKYRAGRTLILTTHHLDEAEVLSDRIAILQHGQLRCSGSPSYLKEKYGQGHSLTFTKKPSTFAVEDPRDTLCVTSLVQACIPQAFLKESSGNELTYMIPREADEASFKVLFQTLDENLQHLPVTGYGISDTTLEEVFLKLLPSTEKTSHIPAAVDLEFTQAYSREPTHKNGSFLTEVQSFHGGMLVLTQIAALLMKRLRHTRRDWRGTLSNVLLPVIFVAMAMALFTVKPLAIDYPSLNLMPGLYDNAESFFSSSQGDNLSHMLLRYFADEDDMCVHSRHNNPLWTPNQFFSQMCPPLNISAPYLRNKKGHTLYNFSGLNVEEYIIRPSDKTRYGGWSFDGRLSAEPQSMKVKLSHHKSLAKVWYNQKGFHSLPSYLNQLNNFILWENLPSDMDWKQYGITLYSRPYGGALLDEDKLMENVRQCGVALCILLGFSILTASIGSSVVKDRVSGAKRLQHITGLGYKTYWVANFLYDMLLYLVPVSLCIGMITVFQLSAFTFRENLAATALLLILFGYATLPWMYLLSRYFSSPDVAFISYISLNFVSGLCTMLVTLLPRLLAVISKGKSFQNIYSILKWAFIVFPQFCLGQGLIELSYNQIKFDLTSNFGINSYVSPFEMNFLGWLFIEMALQGTFLLLLRVLLHWDLLQKPRGSCYHTNTSIMHSEDTDVELERKRLSEGKTHNDILLLYNLTKSYWGFSKRSTAVKGISLGIQRGECFGLLGVNGAGKSTTFKMLTGDVTPSAGRAIIRIPTGSEMDISSAASEGILIGYCPQQDALDDLLTGWEHLYYYGSLRGIPKQYIQKVAEDLVGQLYLDADADKLVRTYSGGTKRKLSTALALVGKPHILLLDEPSSGMDPCSKRYLWKTIMKEVQDGCAAVLTSHSMEECEALCTRLAIMVNGSFKCLGSPQHIKNRFGNGYSVKVWLHKDAICPSAIIECLQFHFPGTLFKGQRLNLLEYHVPQRWGCLADLFEVLESNKASLQMKHYSITQTTLEQVFINFATQQQEAAYSTQGSCTSHHHHLPL